MGFYLRRPRIIPGPVGFRSSGRKSGGGCLGWFLALALLGGAFGVSPVLGWLVFTVAVAIIVALLVLHLTPGRPAKAKPARPAATAAWKADHVPASAEYRRAHPEGPRDWTA